MISSERNSEVFRIVFTIVQILFKDKQASYFQHRVNPVMSRVWAFSTRLAEPCRSFLHSTQTYGSQSYSLKAWIQYPVLSSCEHLGQYHRMNKQLLRIVLAIWKHLICQRQTIYFWMWLSILHRSGFTLGWRVERIRDENLTPTTELITLWIYGTHAKFSTWQLNSLQ